MNRLKFFPILAVLILAGVIACGADGSLQWPGSDSSGSSGDVATTSGDTSSDTTGDVIINVTCSDGSGGTTNAGAANSCVLDTDGDGFVNCKDTCWERYNLNQTCLGCPDTCSTRRTLVQGEVFERGDIIVTCGVPDPGVSTSAGNMVYLIDGDSLKIK